MKKYFSPDCIGRRGGISREGEGRGERKRGRRRRRVTFDKEGGARVKGG